MPARELPSLPSRGPSLSPRAARPRPAEPVRCTTATAGDGTAGCCAFRSLAGPRGRRPPGPRPSHSLSPSRSRASAAGDGGMSPPFFLGERTTLQTGMLGRCPGVGPPSLDFLPQGLWEVVGTPGSRGPHEEAHGGCREAGPPLPRSDILMTLRELSVPRAGGNGPRERVAGPWPCCPCSLGGRRAGPWVALSHILALVVCTQLVPGFCCWGAVWLAAFF